VIDCKAPASAGAFKAIMPTHQERNKMKAYPIWHDVTSCIYKGSKSYGGRDTCETSVYVGTSAKNSELLVSHCTTRRIEGEYTVFRFFVDTGAGMECIKRKWMHTKTQVWQDVEPAELADAA
jgi:hypothetical protein